jgi:hypothetical protein
VAVDAAGRGGKFKPAGTTSMEVGCRREEALASCGAAEAAIASMGRSQENSRGEHGSGRRGGGGRRSQADRRRGHDEVGRKLRSAVLLAGTLQSLLTNDIEKLKSFLLIRSISL